MTTEGAAAPCCCGACGLQWTLVPPFLRALSSPTESSEELLLIQTAFNAALVLKGVSSIESISIATDLLLHFLVYAPRTGSGPAPRNRRLAWRTLGILPN